MLKLNFNYLSTHERNKEKYDAEFKAQVALEAIKERETLNELAVKYEVSPVMISRWEKEFIENSAAAFEAPKVDDAAIEKEKDRYLRVIGDLQMQLDLPLVSIGVALHSQSGYPENWGGGGGGGGPQGIVLPRAPTGPPQAVCNLRIEQNRHLLYSQRREQGEPGDDAEDRCRAFESSCQGSSVYDRDN